MYFPAIRRNLRTNGFRFSSICRIVTDGIADGLTLYRSPSRTFTERLNGHRAEVSLSNRTHVAVQNLVGHRNAGRLFVLPSVSLV